MLRLLNNLGDNKMKILFTLSALSVATFAHPGHEASDAQQMAFASLLLLPVAYGLWKASKKF